MSTTLLPPERTTLPMLPLRDVVVFPHMVIPLFVGRPKSIKALDSAMEAGKSIMLVAQKNAAKDEPGADDIYEIGCVANILQMLKLPDGTVKVLVEGTQRARIHRMRRLFAERLNGHGTGRDFGFIVDQRGMFSYSGLSAEEARRLRSDFGVYVVESGRICVAALNDANIDYVCEAIARVLSR